MSRDRRELFSSRTTSYLVLSATKTPLKKLPKEDCAVTDTLLVSNKKHHIYMAASGLLIDAIRGKK